MVQITKAQVHLQVIKICGGLCGTGTDFSLSVFCFLKKVDAVILFTLIAHHESR
jgi:hypothetical protein